MKSHKNTPFSRRSRMKLIYSLLILSLIVVAGCKRPERSTDAATADPAVTSMHDVETAPLQNSHLATAEFTPVEPEDTMDPEAPEDPDDPETPETPEDPDDPETPEEPDDGGLAKPE
jgi:outer membrane biosynthesis protein TonB